MVGSVNEPRRSARSTAGIPPERYGFESDAAVIGGANREAVGTGELNLDQLSPNDMGSSPSQRSSRISVRSSTSLARKKAAAKLELARQIANMGIEVSDLECDIEQLQLEESQLTAELADLNHQLELASPDTDMSDILGIVNCKNLRLKEKGMEIKRKALEFKRLNSRFLHKKNVLERELELKEAEAEDEEDSDNSIASIFTGLDVGGDNATHTQNWIDNVPNDPTPPNQQQSQPIPIPIPQEQQFRFQRTGTQPIPIPSRPQQPFQFQHTGTQPIPIAQQYPSQQQRRTHAIIPPHSPRMQAALLELEQIRNEEAEDTRRTAYGLQSHQTTPILQPNLHPSSGSYEKLLARQSHAKELPSFGGNPEDWPMFAAEFERTNGICGFSDSENLQRLRKCLKGTAFEAVQGLMINPTNVPTIMERLKARFGNSTHIINALIAKAKDVGSVKEDKLSTIIKFGNAVENLVETMKTLDRRDHLSNPQLMTELEQKLPVPMQLRLAKWNRERPFEKKDLLSFSTWLQGESEAACEICPPTFQDDKKEKYTGQKESIFAATEQTPSKPSYSGKCHYCNCEGHWTSDCPKFKNLSIEERWQSVIEKKLCFRCFKPGHRTESCRFKKPCGKDGCKSNHNFLLHREKPIRSNSPVMQNTPITQPNATTEQPEHQFSVNDNQKLFKIVPVILTGPKGKISTFAYLDEGSSVSMIDNQVAEHLGLNGTHRPLCIKWTKGITMREESSRSVSLNIMGDFEGAKSFNLQEVRTMENLGLPHQSVDMDKLSRKHLHLKNASVKSMQNAAPVILIGEDNLPLAITRKAIHGTWNEPYLSKTWLGWIVHGQDKKSVDGNGFSFTVCHQDSEEDLLHQLVKESFRTENFGVQVFEEKPRSREDKRALALMEETSHRVTGRWETGLLWKFPELTLPKSEDMAFHRLISLEKKIDRDPQLLKWYVEKINDYLTKGYVRKLSTQESMIIGPRTWYLPHFFAFHPQKPGKPRLVFDAAAKSKGVSLNSFLMKGPDLVTPLLTVLFKFREKRFAITADIQEMFHQVLMKEEDKSSQRFLWRGTNREHKPDVYELQVMFFGAASSPTSAQFVKNKNAEEFKSEFPHAYNAIVKKHYVDDYIDSVDSIEEGIKMATDVAEVHRRGGFRIRGWLSNSKEILSHIPHELRSEGVKTMDSSVDLPNGRVLGMSWNPKNDSLFWTINFTKVPPEVVTGAQTPTKRQVLKIVMAIFDPIGFLAHFVIKAKILLQAIWRTEIGWDDQIPRSIEDHWTTWLKELPELKEMEIPRCYSHWFSHPVKKELHVFCDAGEEAFNAVGYMRIETDDGVEVAFVAAKSKVAPLKPLSIPRMELQAAVLASRLSRTIISEHDVQVGRTVLWSDSKTVLDWIRADARTFKTFVAHRIGEIEELTDAASWRWVPTKENVADEGTRLKFPTDLKSNSRWLSGPEFLKLQESEWPKEICTTTTPRIEAEEERRNFVMINAEVEIGEQRLKALPLISRFSSWLRLVRATAWIRRAVVNFSRGQKKEELTVDELAIAERDLVFQSQSQSFQEDLVSMKKGAPLKRTSLLSHLSPALDQYGILRVNGRINKSTIVGPETRNPIILHPTHPYTQLIIQHHHKKAGHHGQEGVVNALRVKFWIPNLRTAVKRAWHTCQICKNRRARPAVPEMGQLPDGRLAAYESPFSNCGMDYFGPLHVTVGRRHEKRYGVLFSCMATRAVHLELAASLTTDSAIMAVRRMAARRGQPKKIWSDNGTNLRGADLELRKALLEYDQDKIQQQLTSVGIQWIFNPPSAPHMGGSWERLVRSVKTAIHATLNQRFPKEEVLQTLMAEAEATVNSRPLTHVSVDPVDPVALTPSNFLILNSRDPTVPGTFDDDDLVLRKQWRTAQRLADMFWKRWIREYLPTLTKRTKWFTPAKAAEVGDVVLVVDDQGLRNTWPLGKITAVIPGKDGQVRMVDVMTNDGCYRRPVSKICILDVRDQQ